MHVAPVLNLENRMHALVYLAIRGKHSSILHSAKSFECVLLDNAFSLFTILPELSVSDKIIATQCRNATTLLH